MGIKFQMAAWLERIGSYQNAIKVLEQQLSECTRWGDVFAKAVADGTAPKLVRSATPKEEEAGITPETLWGKRTRILSKAVGISVKLGQLYADEHVMEPEPAHERLLWAVETLLKELGATRGVEGLREGEGDWMSAEAIGGALEGERFPLGLRDRRSAGQLGVNMALQLSVIATNQDRSSALPSLSSSKLSGYVKTPATAPS